MEWTTHALSGIVLGYTATNDWKLALVSGAFAVVPDLDEPKSKFGKPLFFISLPINQIFGHRTFTHSLLFVAIIGAITAIFNLKFSLAAIIGLLSHIIGDMITGRVQVLYPNKKRIGLKVSFLNYHLIDRMTRIILILITCLIVYQEIQLHL